MENYNSNLNPILKEILDKVITLEFEIDWGVFETKRSLEKQIENMRKGISKTLNSRHIPDEKGIVNAMDIVPYINGTYTWEKKYFDIIIPKFKKIVKELGYENQIQFGHDWGWDSPHIEVKEVKV